MAPTDKAIATINSVKKQLGQKKDWLSIFIIFLLMRILISSIAASVLWNETPAPPGWIPADHPSMQVFSQTVDDSSFAARILLNGWYRWDTGYFVKIGMIGYSAEDGSLSFLPLYPLLIHLFVSLTHGNALLLSLVISNIFCIVSLILMYEVALLETGSRTAAWNTLLYFITFPAAFFLFAGYSESVFIVCALSMWLLIRSGKAQWAAFAASLAVLTRLQGAALILPLGWQALVNLAQTNNLPPYQEIAQTLRFSFRWRSLPALFSPITAALIPIFGLGFFNFGLTLLGLPTIFGAYSNRNSALAAPWTAAAEFIKRIFTIQFLPSDYVDLVLVVIFILLTIIGAVKIRPGLTLFSLAVLGMVFSRSYSPNLLSGFMRFALTTFPIFLVLAKLNLRSFTRNVILLVFVITQLFMVWLFIKWIWVA